MLYGLIVSLSLGITLGPVDLDFLSLEHHFATAVEARNRAGIMCLQPKVRLARKLITDYNSRELTPAQETAVARDLAGLRQSAERCPNGSEQANR